MCDVDFVRDGRVGDEVWHPVYGNGEIDSIDKEEEYPISIRMENGYLYTFTPDGRYCSDDVPTLCWGHRDGFLDQGTPPDRTWKPTKPTPCWVWNDNENQAKAAIVTAHIACVELPYLTIGGSKYKHADPLKSYELPLAWNWPVEWLGEDNE